MRCVIALLLALFSLSQACSTAEKIKCSALAAGCGAACVCDFPVCECCPACIACITATGADCCDCLFPGWSGCSDQKTMNLSKQCSKLFNYTVPSTPKKKIPIVDPVISPKKPKGSTNPLDTNHSDTCSCIFGGQPYSCGACLEDVNQICCESRWWHCPTGCGGCSC